MTGTPAVDNQCAGWAYVIHRFLRVRQNGGWHMPTQQTMAESPSPVPLDYRSADRSVSGLGFVSANQRRIFGVLWPNAILALGYYLTLSRTNGKGDVGFIAVGLFILMPGVVLFSTAVTAFVVPRRCRTRLFAFLARSIVPFALLAIEFVFVDACLPSRYRLLSS